MSRSRLPALRIAALSIFLLVLPAAAVGQDKPDLAKLYHDAAGRKGKRPVIIIPGILGSELVNKVTGEKVWFKIGRSKDDDVRLPIGTDLATSRDNLVPGDIIRKLDIPILRDQEVYQVLINALERYGGYTAGSWESPSGSLNDKYFVFPYDWRRDNVETARRLFRTLEKLRRESGAEDARFNIIAHSMGGLVARYAAMYGDSDLSAESPVPNWAGDGLFNKIFLFGTPNEGSVDALQVLLEGYGAIENINLPFVRDMTPVDLVTMPSAFQLLPHSGTFRIYDENLSPIEPDIYDPSTWRTYGWSIFGERDLLREFTEAEVGRMESYLDVVLKRAWNFHRHLNVDDAGKGKVGFFIIGSDCEETLDAVVIYKDSRRDRWVTLTKPDSFRRSDGVKVQKRQVEALLLRPGDGRVSRRSLLGETIAADKRQSVLFDSALPLSYALFICEEHDKLTGNTVIQNNLLSALVSEASL